MAILGVGDHQAGDERAELERQPGLLGGEAGREDHEQRGRREHLVGADPGDELEQRADQEAGGDPDHQDHGDRLGERDHEAERERAAGLTERLDQHEQRPDRDVLDQEDRDRDAPELGERAPELAEHLEHDRGRRQRERAADDDRALGRQPGERRRARDHRRGHQELRHREAIDPGAEQAQPLELELEAEAEQQEHHAELGDQVNAFEVADDPEARRPDRGAAEQEAEHRAEAQPREDRGEGDEREEHDDRLRHGRRHPLSPTRQGSSSPRRAGAVRRPSTATREVARPTRNRRRAGDWAIAAAGCSAQYWGGPALSNCAF